MDRNLIVNADDFGASAGVNRGILECHVDGIVTSTSLMVEGDAVQEAIALAAEHPGLGVGLHFEAASGLDEQDAAAVGAELDRQLVLFERLAGRGPTHIDSHHHIHREEHLMPVFAQRAEALGVPVRGDGRVTFVGGFYAQWEWKVTELKYVSVEFLQWILREEVVEPWTEVSCHPGYPDPAYETEYDSEREAEVQTLTDPRVRETVEELGLRLATFADVPAWAERSR